MKQAEARLAAWGASITAAGKKLFLLGAVATGGLLGAAKTFADFGSELNDASDRTGIAVEALSALRFAAEQSGASFGDLEIGIKKMQKTIAGGTPESVKALHDLGVTAGELAGMSPEDQMARLADGIAKIQDPSKRAAAAMAVFGKGGTALLPMLKDGAKGLNDLIAEAREAGIVMSTDDAKAADALGDSFDKLKTVIKFAVVAVGAQLAPALTDLFKQMVPVIGTVVKFVRENQGLVVLALKASVALAGAGLGVIVLGKAVTLAAAPLGLLRTGLGGVFSALRLGTVLFRGFVPVLRLALLAFRPLGTVAGVVGGLVSGALGLVKLALGGVVAGFGALATILTTILAPLVTPLGLLAVLWIALAATLIATGQVGQDVAGTLRGAWGSLADGVVSAWQGIKGALLTGWEEIKATAVQTWGGIVDAVMAGDLALALQVAWAGMKVVWAEGIGALEAAWLEFKGVFLDLWSSAVFAVADLLTTMWANLQTDWAATVAMLELGWANFILGAQLAWNSFSSNFLRGLEVIKAKLHIVSEEQGAANVAAINEREAAANEAAVGGRDAKKEAIGQDFNARKGAIEAEGDATRGALAEDQAREKDAREKAKADRLSQIIDEKQAARDALDALTEEAARKRAEAEVKVTDATEKKKLPTEVTRSDEGAGTFSAAVAMRLPGGQDETKRQTDLLQEVVENQREQLRQWQQGALEFT